MADTQLTGTLVDQVVTLAQRTLDDLRDILRTLDLTEPVANLLWLVDPAADPAPLRQLAERLHCDPSNISLMATKLEERGLAERRPHPRDGRVRTLVLTDAGKRVRARLADRMETASPLAALSTTEQRQLHQLLSKALGTHRSGR
ncbi:MarR family transcriptional regulator [Plantactinospora sp. B5E13]|uniref:MarR family winged helix-turn-helix transcriptional regulator n=1 Tax=Plantactinospora sp. B5E13 TaxID=3153758 RepID=UPI00325E4F9D